MSTFKRIGLSILIGLVLAFSPTTRAHGQNESASFTVSRVKNEGMFNVDLVSPAVVQTFPFEVKRVNGQLPGTEAVAQEIVDRLRASGISARRRGATVIADQINLVGRPPIRDLAFRFQSNNVLDAALDQGNFAALPGVGAGILRFAPNPINGRTTLITDAVITAGFTSGLSMISFDAVAGQSIFQLTSELGIELDQAGYVTRPLGQLAIEVFADGATPPTELVFSLVPLGLVDDQGIQFELAPVVVPEPSTALLTGMAGLILAGYAAWRNRRQREDLA